MRDVKSFLHDWCAKNRKEPTFDTRRNGSSFQYFYCELRVTDFEYVGVGYSTKKIDSQKKAACDFIRHLVLTGCIDEVDVADVAGVGPPPLVAETNDTQFDAGSNLVFHDGGLGHDNVDQACNAYIDRGQRDYSYIDGFTEQQTTTRVEEAEDVNVDSGLHGNWTIENAKAKLNQLMQIKQIDMCYKYTTIGTDKERIFRAELSFFVEQLGTGECPGCDIKGRATGSTKQSASKSCALSIIRQLYHLGVIEAFNGSLKTAKKADRMEPYPSKISSRLGTRMNKSRAPRELAGLEINPMDKRIVSQVGERKASATGTLDSNSGISLRTNPAPHDFTSSVPRPHLLVKWSPPMCNWNPWLNCTIDEGPLATIPLRKLSEDMMNDYCEKLQQDSDYQRAIVERSSLPVFAMKNEIIGTVNDNAVIILRGDAGCGKTTQVCQIILDDYIASGFGAYCTIAVTIMPRTISGVSVADRVASERCENVGRSVGYSVRFQSCLPRPYGSIMFCTVEVLLKKLEDGLRGVSHVIIDEIQVRGAGSDSLMITLRDMIPRYSDLRIILMTATNDTTIFRQFFYNCPVIDVPNEVIQRDFWGDTEHPTNVVHIPEMRERKICDAAEGAGRDFQRQTRGKSQQSSWSGIYETDYGPIDGEEAVFEPIDGFLV